MLHYNNVLKCRQSGSAAPSGARSVTTMSWFRSRSRLGAYLALFALAFQLVVSFGHVHLERIAPPSASASALASAQPSADDRSAASNPAGREDLADDWCPICTLIHLAGALVPVEMTSLPLPTVFGRLRLELAAEFDLTASHAALFRARAPPIA
jgi:hypothetical protein